METVIKTITVIVQAVILAIWQLFSYMDLGSAWRFALLVIDRARQLIAAAFAAVQM